MNENLISYKKNIIKTLLFCIISIFISLPTNGYYGNFYCFKNVSQGVHNLTRTTSMIDIFKYDFCSIPYRILIIFNLAFICFNIVLALILLINKNKHKKLSLLLDAFSLTSSFLIIFAIPHISRFTGIIFIANCFISIFFILARKILLFRVKFLIYFDFIISLIFSLFLLMNFESIGREWSYIFENDYSFSFGFSISYYVFFALYLLFSIILVVSKYNDLFVYSIKSIFGFIALIILISNYLSFKSRTYIIYSVVLFIVFWIYTIYFVITYVLQKRKKH